MVRRLTHEEFMERFYEKNENAENIEILGKYINTRTKIKVRCKIDGYEWEVRPNSLLSGEGCPKCSGNVKNKTTEYFINELKEVNDNIEILGEYKGNSIKIKCRCKKDGHEWEAIPSSLLSGYGCPKCAGNINKTTEEFRNELKEVNSDIEVLGEYVNAKTKIKCKCKKCEHEWKAIPNNLLNSQGCPKCGGTMKLTHEEFVNRIKEINDDVEIIGKYIDIKTKIKCKCKKDGHEWEAVPNTLLRKHGCPKCNASKGEKRIAKFLDNRNIEYKSQYKFNNCRSKHKLPFDFYIPSLNIAIEYDGRQHYEIIDYFDGLDGFIDTKIRDNIKTIYCKENNIKLIRIAYWDFDNIEKILEKEL